MRWLLGALGVVTVAGFVAYDVRDRLPAAYTLQAKAAEVCASLPKPGLEGRYQTYPACPWAVRVGPKQVVSGILQPTDHGAWFLPDDDEPPKGTTAWLEWRVEPTLRLWMDEEAGRSWQRLQANNRRRPEGPAYRVKLRGWLTTEAGESGRNEPGAQVLLVDAFLSVSPESPEDGAPG